MGNESSSRKGSGEWTVERGKGGGRRQNSKSNGSVDGDEEDDAFGAMPAERAVSPRTASMSEEKEGEEKSSSDVKDDNGDDLNFVSKLEALRRKRSGSGEGSKGKPWWHFGIGGKPKIPNVKSPSPSFQEEVEQRTRATTDLIMPVTTFAPVVHKKKILGGMIERRDSGLDKVADLDPVFFVDFWREARASSCAKVEILAGTQKKLIDQLEDCENECEKASTALYFDANAFRHQCTELQQLGKFAEDVEECRKSIASVIETCEKLRMLLPPEVRLEALDLSAAAANSGGGIAAPDLSKLKRSGERSLGGKDAPGDDNVQLVYGAKLSAVPTSAARRTAKGKRKSRKKKSRKITIEDA